MKKLLLVIFFSLSLTNCTNQEKFSFHKVTDPQFRVRAKSFSINSSGSKYRYELELLGLKEGKHMLYGIHIKNDLYNVGDTLILSKKKMKGEVYFKITTKRLKEGKITYVLKSNFFVSDFHLYSKKEYKLGDTLFFCKK